MLPPTPALLGVLAGIASTASGFASNKPGGYSRYPFNAPYDQSFSEGYSVLKHVGAAGPYSNRQSYGIGRDPPDGCEVDQVIMLRRHGERWPDADVACKFRESLHKIKKKEPANGKWTDDLEFLNRWKPFFSDAGIMGLETYNGPYSGLLTSYKHGAEYGVRYGHLWDPSTKATIPMFSSGYERVLMTARKFGEGFFGWNYTDVVAMNIIPEDLHGKEYPKHKTYSGANSLTPGCLSYEKNTTCDKLGRVKHHQPHFQVAADRLNSQVAGLDLEAKDIFPLMEMAAFELNVRGYSDWVNVFTLDEWVAFGYTEDLKYYYCHGPGNDTMRAIGSVFANASLTVLNEGPKKAGKMFFNFAHEVNITPVLAALGISTPKEHLPLHHIPFPNEYSISNIVPMGAHLTIERLSCKPSALSKKGGIYVRQILNEAVVPYEKCQHGPGFSCPLEKYTKLVSKSLPSFIETCGYNSSFPQHLSFWWDYHTSNKYDYETQKEIPFQEGKVTAHGTSLDGDDTHGKLLTCPKPDDRPHKKAHHKYEGYYEQEML